MAICKTRHTASLAAVLLSVCFVCLKVSADSNVEKTQQESNDFDVSIEIINGKINIKWSGQSFWQNTTVYFVSSLNDYKTNSLHIVNVNVCHAFTKDNKSWNIKPIEGNLLQFCNMSKKCGKVNNDNSLVRATTLTQQELSCELFTTCVNFEDTFLIEVISEGNGTKHSFKSDNMTIPSENIPPFYDMNSDRKKSGSVDPVQMTIEYFDKQQLCGFGAKLKKNLQFVFKHYKISDAKCFYLGQRSVPYNGKWTSVKFNDITIEKKDVVYLDYAVKSLINNKTTPWQQIQFTNYPTTDCNMTGGIIYISWQPRWSCFSNGLVEHAEFCFVDNKCYRVCEASFFANGSLHSSQTYGDKMKEACRNRPHDCELGKKQKDIKFITMSWSPERQKITCSLFKTCMDYQNQFSVNVYSNNTKTIRETNVCPSNSQPHFINHPGTPHDVRVVDVQHESVTIAWRSPKCEIDAGNIKLEVIFKGTKQQVNIRNVTSNSTNHNVDLPSRNSGNNLNYIFNCKADGPPQYGKVPLLVKDLYPNDGLNYIFYCTKGGLSPFENVTFKILAENQYDTLSTHSTKSPLQYVITKPSVPQSPPNLDNIYSENGGIKLKWKLKGNLYGPANLTKIVGKVNNTVIYRHTIYGEDRSVVLPVNKTQKCADYEVKICNGPDLCSDFSNSQRLLTCGKVPTPGIIETTSSSSLNNYLILIISLLITFVVVIAVCFFFVYLCDKKRRKTTRSMLPNLEGEKEQTTGDYIAVSQLSQPAEIYQHLDKEESLDALDKEDCFDELNKDDDSLNVLEKDNLSSC